MLETEQSIYTKQDQEFQISKKDLQVVHYSFLMCSVFLIPAFCQPGSRKNKDLISWLENDLLIRFGERIIPLDLPVMLIWGTMVAELEKTGTPLPATDSLLAASASQRGLTLVTRNTKDFEPAGIPLINPWIV